MISHSTRRELLAAVLGAGVAGACRSRGVTPSFDGGFAPRAIEAGHLLRDGFSPAPAAEVERARVIVVGAGVAGLSAAWALRRAGLADVRVLELEGLPGGTSASGRSRETAYPWGAHYLPVPSASNGDLVELLREVGCVTGDGPDGEPRFDERHLVLAPQERVFFRGTWHEGLFPRAGATEEDLRQLDQLERLVGALARRVELDGPSGAEPRSRRAFALPIAASSTASELSALDGMSMAEWLDRNRLSSPLVRWMVEHGCRDDFGTELGETSAWYGLHYFCARRGGDGESAEYLTWPEGNGFLVDHLLSRIGPERLVTGLLATSVQVVEGGRARVTAWSPGEARARCFEAERVVLAVPAFLRGRILRGFEDPGARFTPEHSPWLVANLHLSGQPPSVGFPRCWDNVIHGSRSLGYVVATHQRGQEEGPTVWTYYLPFTGPRPREERAKLLALSFEEAAAVVLHDLGRCHDGLLERVRRIDVMRWGHAMPRPLPGLYTSAERALASRPVGPIHFAHTDLSGVGLFEEAFFHGIRAARELVAAIAR